MRLPLTSPTRVQCNTRPETQIGLVKRSITKKIQSDPKILSPYPRLHSLNPMSTCSVPLAYTVIHIHTQTFTHIHTHATFRHPHAHGYTNKDAYTSFHTQTFTHKSTHIHTQHSYVNKHTNITLIHPHASHTHTNSQAQVN